MMKWVSPPISLLGWLAAAVVAPALASGLASLLLFFGETLPHLLELRPNPPDLRATLLQEVLTLVGAVLLGPMLSVPLGFVGACIFLAPLFWLAESHPRRWAFVSAGGAAGAIHAISGATLASLHAGPAWLLLMLGYLPYGFRSESTLAFGVGAVGAGFIAGYLYAAIRALRKPDFSPLWRGP